MLYILYSRNKEEWRKCKKNKSIRKRDKRKVLLIFIYVLYNFFYACLITL